MSLRYSVSSRSIHIREGEKPPLSRIHSRSHGGSSCRTLKENERPQFIKLGIEKCNGRKLRSLRGKT